MRRQLLVWIIAFCISTASFGQGAQLGFFYLPQKTSISNSISDKDNPIYQNKTTFGGGAGINFTYWKTDNLGIQVGLMYISHNQKFVSKYKNLAFGADSMRIYKGKKRLDYIKLPVLLTLRSQITPQFGLFGYAGPQFAYLIKGDGAVVIFKNNGDGVSDYFDLPPSGSNFYNKFLIEAVLGGGFQFNISSELSIAASLRFDYSLNDVENKNAKAYEDLDLNLPLYTYGDENRKGAHNSSLGLMLSFNYHLSGKNDMMRPGGGRPGRKPMKRR